MNLDVRIPISLLFIILGAIITVCGLVLPPETYEKSLNINVNLIWGLVLIGFSCFMQLWICVDKRRDEANLALSNQKNNLQDDITIDAPSKTGI